MSNRRATRPLDPAAVQAANESLWQQYPELQGRQLTMGPEDYEYRRAWMDAYADAGGGVDEPSPPRPPDGPVNPCPSPAPQPTPPPAPQPEYTVREAHWITTEAYCGDEAQLEAVILGYPAETPATVEIYRLAADGSMTTIYTIHTTVRGGRIDATWDSKAPSADWRNDRIKFRIHAPSLGVHADSSNEFRFRQRPTTGWTLINRRLPDPVGFAPPDEKTDASLEADRVHYSLKFRLHGATLTAAAKAALEPLAKNEIETTWNNGFSGKRFHRTRCRRGRACDCRYDCCKAGFRLDINYVAGGEHVPIEVFVTAPGTARHRSSMNGDGGEWGYPALNPGFTYAHETGHVLGQYDEYSAGATDPTGEQPANAATANLMRGGSNDLLNRHYRWVLAFLNQNAAGDPYEIIPP